MQSILPKWPNLELKTRPLQILGYILLDIVLPGYSDFGLLMFIFFLI
jgi:hypothetical protein